MNLSRIDLFFSVWIYIWVCLFLMKTIKYNPTFALICAFVYISLYAHVNTNFQKFVFINYIPKVSCFILLHITGNIRINIVDVIFTIFLFSIYLFYLYANNTNMQKVYITFIQSFVE